LKPTKYLTISKIG